MSSLKNPDYLCSCGEKIRECSFFTELKKRLEQQGIEFELDEMNLMFNIFESEWLNRYFTQKLPLIDSGALESARESILRMIPSYRRFMNNMHVRNDAFIKAVLELQNADVFVDANKNPYRIKRLAENHELLPIYLYKNGIGGAYSFYSKADKVYAKMSFKQACIKWFKEQININRVIHEAEPSDFVSISYSEMCRDTQGVSDKIYQLCGLEPVDVSNFNSVEHHIVGNSMRVSNIDKIKEKTDWKDNLTQKDIDTYRRQYDRYMPRLIAYNPSVEKEIWYQD